MSVTTPSTPGAIFLSYAREDVDAARRIAEALRSQGVEMWFDQSELRGGEAWDAKIRKQIQECSLFLAVVSDHTQARPEGYFRREWKLAVERTNDMAAGMVFVVPVVIDDTAEAQAVVPDEFMRVQWTRLSGALPTPQFVAQVKRLLSKEQGARSKEHGSPSAARGQGRAALQKKPGLPVWMWGAVAVGVFVIAAFLVMRQPEPPAALPKTLAEAKPATPVISEKSIAVLPFDNISTDKENAFFADGVHEDILTNLAKIADLKVISRTSVMEYRGTTKKIQQIARELGVAYVLEGSVRRAGSKVRVVCQLIDGRTGRHVLAPDPYDRDLADIFAIQSELAKSIAAKLKAVLSPGEKAALERAPTVNLTAYDLYLKAREVNLGTLDRRTRVSRQQPLLESALQYDPKFALAWRDLAEMHLRAFNSYDHSDARAAQAKAALDMAVALDPDNVLIISMLANYHMDMRDLTRAEEQGARLARLFPNHSETFLFLGKLAARQERRTEALSNYRKARRLDPRNTEAIYSEGTILWSFRQYDKAGAVMRESLELVPDNLGRAYVRAMVAFDARGSATAVEALLATLTPEARRTDPDAIGRLSHWAIISGDADEVIRLWEQSGPNWRVVVDSEALGIAVAFVVKGELDKARPILEMERKKLAARLASQPGERAAWYQLAMTHALLGEKREALEGRQKALLAASDDLENSRRYYEVVFNAWVGDKDQALAELAQALQRGEIILNVHRIRRSLFFRPLQGDPRFEALLNDPKNNAPLF